MKYIVRVIIPDGKNKMIVEEEYNAACYITEEVTNNLVLFDELNDIVIEFHTYNWLSIKPKKEE